MIMPVQVFIRLESDRILLRETPEADVGDKSDPQQAPAASGVKGSKAESDIY